MPGKGNNNNRDRIRDPREEILLETNFEDDGGVLTRAYNNNPYQNRRHSTYQSEHSLDRYTERGGEGRRTTKKTTTTVSTLRAP